MALFCVIASTEFLPVTDDDADLYREMKEKSDGVQILFNLVSEFLYNNAPMFLAYPDFAFSKNDTVQ